MDHDPAAHAAEVAHSPGRDALSQELHDPIGGEALPASVRDPMSETLGDSLSDVRVHNDARSASLVRSLGAQGFTYGRNIYVGGNASDDLLAHEAAHAAQHHGGTPSGPVAVGGDAAHEEYADRAAANRYVKMPVAVPKAGPRVRLKGGSDGDVRSFIAGQMTSESKAAELLKQAKPQGRAMVESLVREKFKDKAEEIIKANPPGGGATETPTGTAAAKSATAAHKGQATKGGGGKGGGKVEPKVHAPPGGKADALITAKIAEGPKSADDIGSFKGISSTDLGLIHQELIEHEEWKEARGGAGGLEKGKVGEAGSVDRALFVADKTGAGVVGGFGEGFATGVVATGATKLVEFGAMKVAGSEVPGIGPIIAGAMSGYALYKKNWKESGEKFKAFGKGGDDYEVLANSLGAVGEAIDIAVNVLNVIAGIVAAIGLVMWIVTLCTLGVAAPLAILLTEIAAGIVTATLILDALNKLCIQPMILLMRAMHTFKSEADPRDVKEQGEQLQETAAGVSGFIGNIAGGKAAEKGMKVAGIGGEAHADVEKPKGGETKSPEAHAETKPTESHAETKPTESHAETKEPTAERKGGEVENKPAEVETKGGEGEKHSGEPEKHGAEAEKKAGEAEGDKPAETKQQEAERKKAQAEKKLHEAETEKAAAEKKAEDQYKENKAERKKAFEEHEEAAKAREAAHEQKLESIETERKAEIERARQEAEAKTRANKEAAATEEGKLAEAKGNEKAAREQAADKRAADVKAAKGTHEAEVANAKENLDGAKAANKAHAEAEANPEALKGKAEALENGHKAAMEKISQIEEPAAREQAERSEAEKYRNGKESLREQQAEARKGAADKQAQADAKAKADYAKEVASADAKRDAAVRQAKASEATANEQAKTDFEAQKATVEAEKARLEQATREAKQAETAAKDQANRKAEQDRFDERIKNSDGKQREDLKLEADKQKIKHEGHEASERLEKANEAAKHAEEAAEEARKEAARSTPIKRAAGWIKDWVVDPMVEPLGVKKNFEKAHKDIDLMPVKERWNEAKKEAKDKEKEKDEKALKPNDEAAEEGKHVDEHEAKADKADEAKGEERKAADAHREDHEADQAAKAPVKPEPKGEGKKLTEDEEKEREKAGRKVSPKYADPPGTEKEVERLKAEILDNLAARTTWEQAQRAMAIKKATAEGDSKKVAALEKEAKEGTESSKEHQAATNRKDAAVKAQKARTEEGKEKLTDGTNRMVGIGVLQASLWGFEKFTGLAEKLPGSVGAKFHGMHEDSVKFQGAITNMKKMLADKKAAADKGGGALDKDAADVEGAKSKGAKNTGAMDANAQSAAKLKARTDATGKAATEEELKAQAAAAKTAADAKAAEDSYKTLTGGMKGWATTHRQARLDAQHEGRELEEKEQKEATERRKRWAEEAAKGMAAGGNPYGSPMM